jgi:AcrR family transcriptional regulator
VFVLPKEKNKEQDIIKAASLVFCEKGFTDSSMKDIADGAEVGKGTIYEYFKSKEELFISVMEYNHQVYLKQLQEVLNEKIHFEEKMDVFFDFHQSLIQKNSKQIEWMIQHEVPCFSDHAKESLRKLMLGLREKVVSILNGVLTMGVLEGKIRHVNQEFVADLFFEMCIRTSTRFVKNHYIEAQKREEKEKLFDLFFRGVKI